MSPRIPFSVFTDTAGHGFVEMVPGDGKLVQIGRDILSSTFGWSWCWLLDGEAGRP
ncbi:MAG TPA: hypothetical protein VJY35_08900 [Candidatus Eisenbacteria bacterium]|nr:hypothetical protein [Candidatus Eisenbacteria bacterium]